MLESRFAEIEGCQVHYWAGGEGFPLLLLHGVGPGTSIVGNYGPVLEELAKRFRVVAPDWIGFGKSARKSKPPYFDVGLWIRQGLAMLHLLPEGPCGVAGHSLGGAIALKLAARSPRIVRVLTSSSVGAQYPINAALDGFWSLPRDRATLRTAMERMVDEPAMVTEEMLDGRWSLLQSEGYASYFSEMFAEPRQRYLDAAVLSPDELARIKVPVVMLHGRNDQPCPAKSTTLVLADSLPRADVHLFGACGHNLPRERSDDYLAAAMHAFASFDKKHRS